MYWHNEYIISTQRDFRKDKILGGKLCERKQRTKDFAEVSKKFNWKQIENNFVGLSKYIIT